MAENYGAAEHRTGTGRKKHPVLSLLGVILAILVLAAAVSCVLSEHALTVTEYNVEASGLSQPLRIVHMADLHSHTFGRNNARLAAEVEAQSPDLIFITGDWVDYDDSDYAQELSAITALSQIAPVYISLGNHEAEIREERSIDFSALYSAAGAVVLDRSYVSVTVNGQRLRIGGIYGYCMPQNSEAVWQDESEFLRDFQDTEDVTLLLCHMPYAWYHSGSLDSWNIDFVFCGHTHGGQIRLPFIGGLYAPDMGFFPGKEKGIYNSEDGTKHMLLTTGLGSTEIIPRLNNIPEIAVVTLS